MGKKKVFRYFGAEEKTGNFSDFCDASGKHDGHADRICKMRFPLVLDCSRRDGGEVHFPRQFMGAEAKLSIQSSLSSRQQQIHPCIIGRGSAPEKGPRLKRLISKSAASQVRGKIFNLFPGEDQWFRDDDKGHRKAKVTAGRTQDFVSGKDNKGMISLPSFYWIF